MLTALFRVTQLVRSQVDISDSKGLALSATFYGLLVAVMITKDPSSPCLLHPLSSTPALRPMTGLSPQASFPSLWA